MNLIEALKAIQAQDKEGQREPWLWARPASWRGTGMAVSWHSQEERFIHVPAPGPFWDSVRLPSNLDEDWEVVEADKVNAEGRARRKSRRAKERT